eukprot:GILI01024734.1.p1 GENE.GILI01024734.1~~GILI01024734.1.p1  ORF type:complete len:307 (-),score=89.08 GILI01024734.1:38-895(-)
MSKRRVGLVGYGHLGQYLAHAILDNEKFASQLELTWVWNRSISKVREDPKIRPDQILEDLSTFPSRPVDIIVEVAHPNITAQYGPSFIQHADYFLGSPTAFADSSVETACRQAAASSRFGLYVPAGAFWGGADICKMADRGTLKGLAVTMKKHPDSFRLEGSLQTKLDEVLATKPEGEVVLYEGPVRHLCPLAPNNVNTMAVAAIAGHNLGFDNVVARLICDFSLMAHVIDIEVEGPTTDGQTFKVSTCRYNPAKPGAVTGSATYVSFASSLLEAHGRGSGVHLC